MKSEEIIKRFKEETEYTLGYIEVEAETILKAKKKVKEMGHEDLKFVRIKINP